MCGHVAGRHGDPEPGTLGQAAGIGTGRVFATDIDVPALATIREYATREGLNNVTVIEGASAPADLPPACCDAIFRHVYVGLGNAEEVRRRINAG